MTYGELLRLANAFSESQTLLAANDLDVFTAIGSAGRTAEAVARRCKADPEGMFLLLNALVGLELLTLRKGRYYNTPLGRRHLDRRSPEAISNLLWLLRHHWQDWTDIPKAIRQGRPGWAPLTKTTEFRRRFSLAMHERSFMLAELPVSALRPGGKAFIVEFFLDDSLTKPVKASVFSVMMYKFTATGRCYSWREVEGWLKALGFRGFKRHTVTPDIGTLEATKL